MRKRRQIEDRAAEPSSVMARRPSNRPFSIRGRCETLPTSRSKPSLRLCDLWARIWSWFTTSVELRLDDSRIPPCEDCWDCPAYSSVSGPDLDPRPLPVQAFTRDFSTPGAPRDASRTSEAVLLTQAQHCQADCRVGKAISTSEGLST